MLTKNLSSPSKTLYYKFLGFLIKKGSKTSAKKILDKTFLIVSKIKGISMNVAMLRLFLRLNSFVEVKKVRVGRRSVSVPFSINLKRRSYLVVKWLMQAIKDDRKQISFSERLSDEILSTLSSSTSKSKKLKIANVSQAIKNRANIHYRW